MTPDVALIAPSLELRDPGIWFARTVGPVSYPAHGHSAMLAIEERSFWFRHRNRCIVSVVRRFSPHVPFFDIGGGNGVVATGLTSAGIACALIEPGLEGALAAHARGIDPVICARLEDVGLRPASVAAAGMFDVLEHIEDEAAALRHVHTMLAAGGRLFLTVPAYSFLFSAEDVADGHFRRYTMTGLTRALAKSGFRVEFASYLFAPLPPLIFVLRTLPTWLRLRRGWDREREGSEHAPTGVAGYLMDRALAAEYKRIEGGGRLATGGSCLCVAIKD